MKPLFTVHAGEFLVACKIERKFRHVNIWVPAKDTGIDLLITNSKNTKRVSLQVKFSRAYVSDKGLRTGFWTLTRQKIKDSKADFWVFVLVEAVSGSHDFIIISPDDLLKRLGCLHSKGATLRTYFCMTPATRGRKSKCYETRGLKEQHLRAIAEGRFEDDARDFTKYLGIWEPMKALNH